MAVVVGFGAGLVQPMSDLKDGNWQEAGKNLVRNYTGYDLTDHKWWFGNLTKGLLPLVIGIVVHKVVGGFLGVNRALGRARVPILRV